MNLSKQVKKALICEKKCGHKLDYEICFEHQIKRVEEIITKEKDKMRMTLSDMISVMKEKQYESRTIIETILQNLQFNKFE